MRGSVVKRGKMYSIVYYVDKKQKWEKAGTNKHEADKLLAERLAQINRGEWIEVKKKTFADFAELWFTQYANSAVKQSTLVSYRSNVKNHLLPPFGKTDLTKITLEDVQRFVTEKHSKGLSSKTINNLVVILKEMFKHAVRWGYLRQNPAQYVEKPRIQHREMDFFTPEEIRFFWMQQTWYVLNDSHCFWWQ